LSKKSKKNKKIKKIKKSKKTNKKSLSLFRHQGMDIKKGGEKNDKKY